MKKIALLHLLMVVILTSISCSSQSKRSRKPVSNITIQPAAKNYIIGTPISVSVDTKLRNGEIDNIKLFHNGVLVQESSEMNFTVNNINIETLGNNILNVVATKTDGVDNTRSISFTVLSDITPKKYTYKTIKDFPHNNQFYTQGLEYHNGHIYEGTGEHGKSGLYKVEYQTGESIMKHKLDYKYFGEGITIINDKIYQLTYRAQKGFVYNLDNFAVIDSFTYKSREGWGLTNDGTHLIMSNGTHELIWLDPTNYSEIKKVQVANHSGIVNYINELEYINETIYANIYTTNIIVQIDPQTGKVLSEINMDGILKMYTNPTDTIDYLNGIAYDKDKERIFVTGKWWPRMFEIELMESE